jgi:hypothetical protein
MLYPNGGFSMTESFWKSDVLEEAQTEQPAVEETAEAVAEQAQESSENSAAALSVDEFSALEERILRTVNLVKQERQARADAEERAVKAELQLRETDGLKEEVSALRSERDHVRKRVESLLSQLDALEL